MAEIDDGPRLPFVGSMTGRPRGSFVWADLVPADQDRAIAFYVELIDTDGASLRLVGPAE